MSKKKIGILSDTHGILRDEILEVLRGCDAIFHGGDINRQDIVDTLESIAPTYVVRGNNDKEWAKYLPEDLATDLFGFRFYMIHIQKFMRTEEADKADFVIYGHSHKYEEKLENGVHFLNPGSCGPRRFHQPVTMMVLHLDEEAHTYELEKVDVSPILGVTVELPKISALDLKQLVYNIMKDIDSGKNIDKIAKRNRVSADFADQICRMYLTHQGIDADGIIERLELRKLYRK